MINIVSIVCRFMKNWKRQSPSSYCFLRYDKLYIDNRLFVWDKERQDVVEQGEVPGGPPAASRWGHRYIYNIEYQVSTGATEPCPVQAWLQRLQSVVPTQLQPHQVSSQREAI